MHPYSAAVGQQVFHEHKSHAHHFKVFSHAFFPYILIGHMLYCSFSIRTLYFNYSVITGLAEERRIYVNLLDFAFHAALQKMLHETGIVSHSQKIL